MKRTDHRRHPVMTLLSCLCAAALVLSGCTSMYNYTPEAALENERILKVGKEVSVLLTDGQSISGTIESVGNTGLTVLDESGSVSPQIEFSAISELDVRQVSVGKSLGMAALVLVVVTAAAIASTDCFVFCFGGT